MKVKARLWNKLENNKVKCNVCANECIIGIEKLGICRTRKNIKGELYTLIYGSHISKGSLDPIEKKPLYNFWPGHIAYSIASIGCSFRCLNCQNWSISQANPTEDGKNGFYDIKGYEDSKMSLYEMTPKQLINRVINSGAKTLAYTYNEPLIWHEWIIDTTTLLKKEGIKSILVTNGFSTPEASKELIQAGIDAVNIDIKGMSDDFYKKICGAKSVQPVLDTAKFFKENKVHVEITNLLIPNLNDSREDIEKLCDWVLENLGNNTPVHFSAYHPDFKIPSQEKTSFKTLDLAYNLAIDKDLFFPYIGNIRHENGSNTFCPSCKKILIKREGYRILNKNISLKNTCKNCSYDLKDCIKGDINNNSSNIFSFL
ncbi:MAG: AmmeMemoRadiSam system radical SAM enzyme [Candidatus Lokiarchaeota archaeon]|nr:AmmeMemoRadiSam system radical SAM enzyme [Candidatus Lokiarchaeota archaeon]